MSDKNAGSQQTTLRDFLNVVFKRRVLILSVIGLVTVLVFFLNARKPVFYDSGSRILVRRGEQYDRMSGAIRYLGWAEEVSSQIQVILSDEVFERASDMFADSLRARGMPETLQFNPSSVRADVVGESNVFVISYVNVDPKVCQLGCEVMTLAFRDYYRERKQPPELSDFFTNQIVDVRTELEHWREKRKEFLDREQFYGASQTANEVKHKMSQLESGILTLDQDISAQRLRVETLKRYSQMPGAELEQQFGMTQAQNETFLASMVQSIKFKLQQLALQKEDLQNKYTDQHPEIIAINEQIRELRLDLERQVKNAYRAAEEHLKTLQLQRGDATEELAKAKVEWEAIPARDRQLTEIDNTIDTMESKLKMLLDKQSESEIANASRSDWEVTILSHASRPVARRTRDYVRLLLGPLLAFVAALGMAFFLESLDHTFKNMAEVEEYLDMPVLATISEFR